MDEDKKELNTENTENEISVKEENSPAGEEENTNAGTQNFVSEDSAAKEEKRDKKAEKEEVATEKQEESAQPTPEKTEEDIKSGKIYPDVIPGANVKVYQKIKEKKGKEEKERIQIFEGIVLARKGGSSIGATITVQKICKGGFEVKKIFPLHLPTISKIEVGRQAKVRKAKLSFLKRTYKKKLKYA